MPLAAFAIVYLGALAFLVISSFWTVSSFTATLEHTWNLANYRQIFDTSQPYLRIAGRTVGIAAAVTLTDAVLAFPLAYFMARLASKRTRALLFVMVLLPMWASYLVRIYAWQTILAHGGSSNVTSPRSRGIRTPRSARHERTPSAICSFATKTASSKSKTIGRRTRRASIHSNAGGPTMCASRWMKTTSCR